MYGVVWMDIEYYKNYVEIVEKGNISAAARNCHLAQPALSNQLKVLEKFYGAKLLIRGSRKVELTEAEKIVYKGAKKLVELEFQIAQE